MKLEEENLMDNMIISTELLGSNKDVLDEVYSGFASLSEEQIEPTTKISLQEVSQEEDDQNSIQQSPIQVHMLNGDVIICRKVEQIRVHLLTLINSSNAEQENMNSMLLIKCLHQIELPIQLDFYFKK